MVFPWNESSEKELLRLPDPVTGSNCYLCGEGEEWLVIDPNSWDVLEPELLRLNIKPSLVLLTHEHCDHTGGLNALREKYAPRVVASEACSHWIQDEKENMSRMMELFLYFKNGSGEIVHYAPFVCAPADETFSEETEFSFSGRTVMMKLLPGHTEGSIVIWYDGRLFCGDYLIEGEEVNTRLPGGSAGDYEKYARPWLAQIPDGTHIFPGHGEPFFMNAEVRSENGL